VIGKYERDKQLAAAVCAGDRGAFDQFFRDYFPRLFRFALGRLSGDADLAKDMVQQTMIKSMRALPAYRGEAALFTWLCQLCRSEISAYRRKAARRSKTVVSINPAGGDIDLAAIADDPALEPSAMTERTDRLRSIHTLLDTLPGDYGAVLELKYVEGCSVEEIADRLATGTTAIQSMLARARKAFRQAAQDAGLRPDQ